MSNVNDNNLDDLLRRAAEKYPLRTDSADFSKVVADLERDPSLILPPLNTEDRRRRRRFFWLFLLLPLAGGAYFAWHAGARSTGSVQAATQMKAAGSGAPAIAAGEDGIVSDATPATGAPADRTPAESTPATGTSTTGSSSSKTPATGKPVAKTPAIGTSVTEIRTTATPATRTPATRTPTAGTPKTIIAKTVIPKNANPGNGNARNVPQKNVIPGHRTATGGKVKDQHRIQTPSDLDNVVVTGHRAVDRDRTGLGSKKIPMAATKGTVNVNIPVSAKAEQSSVTIDQPSARVDAPAKAKNIRLQKPKHSFYVGILGSPDLSTIKFQSVKSVGDNIGVLFGYTLNSRWSIETGLFYDRKKYYTNGEYFSKSKLPAPMQDIDLKKVDGGCNMWEIPLNVRYNFKSANGKMQWFATAGFSTYLMSKEQYTFWGTYWGNPGWHKTYPYDTPYKYWFSILNLSAGFEQPLGKIGNLRLEPFVRVPLSGVGTGSLSIMSAGLNIGITRKLW